MGYFKKYIIVKKYIYKYFLIKKYFLNLNKKNSGLKYYTSLIENPFQDL